MELLTINEVAKLFKVSVTSVRRLQWGRHILFLKVGDSIRFSKNDIIDCLNKIRIDVIR